VQAFFAAARGGDLQALVSVLDPDVVSRVELPGGRSRTARGAEEVAASAMTYANPRAELQPVVVNGSAGVVARINGRPVAVMGFTIRNGRVAAIDGINDPGRLSLLDLPSQS
ncbi:MAG TPA: nuclear transport factor 2 family protein, partial [Acidimicrobiales bacterium]|nr:nuclear transport factor 2 family protein [Acidimicrobiales bacterium]